MQILLYDLMNILCTSQNLTNHLQTKLYYTLNKLFLKKYSYRSSPLKFLLKENLILVNKFY